MSFKLEEMIKKGDTFGYLTATGMFYTPNGKTARHYEVGCRCGVVKYFPGISLKHQRLDTNHLHLLFFRIHPFPLMRGSV